MSDRQPRRLFAPVDAIAASSFRRVVADRLKGAAQLVKEDDPAGYQIGSARLNLYGWLGMNEWPWAERILATDHYPPASTTATIERTDATMDATMRDLAKIARRADADVDYRPTPGPHCGHCQSALRCPDAADPDLPPRATDPQTR